MLTPVLDEVASLARLDYAPQHRQPPASRVLLATVTAIAGSLAADAILAAIGEAVFPGTKGYVHGRGTRAPSAEGSQANEPPFVVRGGGIAGADRL